MKTILILILIAWLIGPILVAVAKEMFKVVKQNRLLSGSGLWRNALKEYFQQYPKVEFLWAWYDVWLGIYWDKKNGWLYILPLPTVGIIIKFNNA